MKRFSRDTWLALVLFLLLTAVTAVAVLQEVQNAIDQPALASFSEEPEGARAFWLYLRKKGFTVDDTVRAEFAIPPATDVVLMLEPLPGISAAEWEVLDEWVEDGGTLVIAGGEYGTDLAMRHYDFRLRYQPQGVAALAVPLLTSPPLPAAPLAADLFLETTRQDTVTHLATTEQRRPVVVSVEKGDGRVVLSALPRAFTNHGLRTEGHAELALNLISAHEETERIWFDEWHHGVRPPATAGSSWWQQTPVGRALLYVGGVIFLGLVLRGRLFGRPLPLARELSRRAPLEYISGVANLNRRAGHRTAVMQDYHDRLKRQLGFRYRLSPALPDAEFVTRLAEYDPTLDAAALSTLLARLSRPHISEQEMITLAAEAARFTGT